MSRKKNGGSKAKAAPQRARALAAPKRSTTRALLAIAGIALVAVIAIAVFLGGQGTAGDTSNTAGADPQEAKYIGRLLPAGYEEPKLQDAVIYTEATSMTESAATDSSSSISVPVDEIVSKRNLVIEYTRQDGSEMPLIAYLKPSGRLFVGVSFCPPCEGEGQTIAADLTLTCDSCGTKRDLESGVGIGGSCKLYPLDELPSKVVGGDIVVEKAVLDGWTAQPKDRPIG